MPLDPDLPKGICKESSKNPVAVSSRDKSKVTVVGCVSVLGTPPMVKWDLKALHPDMIQGTIYELSLKGGID